MSEDILKEGDKAPGFRLVDAYEKERMLEDYLGKWVVLYFYPKDNTPGCTLEALEFSDLKKDFESNDAVVLGVSKDSCESHQKFIDSRGLTISLLSDPNAEIQGIYGVWKPKKFMGREFLGTQRTTFLIDKKGIIRKIWDKVKPLGHAKKVLEEITSLKD